MPSLGSGILPSMAGASGFSSTRSFRPQFLLRAFKYRNYRLFFSGQIVSLVGTWLSIVATSWLVYRLATENPDSSFGSAAFVLGLVGFASQVPQLLLAPLAGVWVDRVSRHKMLMATQFFSMCQSVVLAYLAVSRNITIPQILALNVFQGIVNAFDMPARQAFVVEMIENHEDLSNAIALSSSMVHVARFMGPAIGGFLIYHFGESSCFMIDAVSYLAVLMALVCMHVKPIEVREKSGKIMAQMKDGLHYAWHFPPIRSLLILTSITSVFYMALGTLLPIFASKVLGGESRVYGLLLGASGLGAFVGAILLAARRSVVGLGRLIAYSNTTLGMTLMFFAVSRHLGFSLAMLVISGFCMVSQMASSNTILQTIVEPSKRGRVMSLFGMAFLGMAPIGSLIAGSVADGMGPSTMIAIAGAVIALTGLVFTRKLSKLREHIRPIYERLGLYGELPPG